MERPHVIPLSMIEERASVNSRNGQTITTSRSGVGAAEDLERSETKRCSAVDAIAKSTMARAGIHNQVSTSEETWPSTEPESTSHERYVTGMGSTIDAPEIENAGRAIGPATASHQRPQSDSESLDTSAGDEIDAIKAGASTNAARSRLLLDWRSKSINKEYESRMATIAGVALPTVSMGFRSSILIDHRIRHEIARCSLDWMVAGKWEGSPDDSPGDSRRSPSSIVRILSAHEERPLSCVATNIPCFREDSALIHPFSISFAESSRPSDGSSRRTTLGVSLSTAGAKPHNMDSRRLRPPER